jgi:peptide/nickel transport system ATP-binding protein
VVEHGSCEDVLTRPAHPYTQGLLDSVPARNPHGARLRQIPGMTPSLAHLPPGCAFRDRCGRADARCAEAPPTIPFGTGASPRGVRCHVPLVRIETPA